MDQETLAVRIDRVLIEKLDTLARDTESTRDVLLIEAITKFVDEESDLIAAIKRGESDIDAGRFVTHEQLMQELHTTYARKDAA